jgi:hypothetical protein
VKKKPVTVLFTRGNILLHFKLSDFTHSNNLPYIGSTFHAPIPTISIPLHSIPNNSHLLQGGQTILIAPLKRLARPTRNTNELALTHQILRSNVELNAVGIIGSVTSRIPNLQRRVRADELVVNLLDEDGGVELVGEEVAGAVAVYGPGVDCGWDCVLAVCVGEEDQFDGGA